MTPNCILFVRDGLLSFRRNTQTLPQGAVPLEYDCTNLAHREVRRVAEDWNWEWCGNSYPARLPIAPDTCERAVGVDTM